MVKYMIVERLLPVAPVAAGFGSMKKKGTASLKRAAPY
jgi:hypothetical protein